MISIPMTPRTVHGTPNIDFARQVAVQEREQQDRRQQSDKKFRSSAAPKGTKLAPGYRDRTQDRLVEGDEGGSADGVGAVGQDTTAGGDDRARRIRALEESMKLGQIDRATFERLRDDITGGDIRATHLVKGLDRRLLERVRRGEDVLSGNGNGNTTGTMTNHKRSQSPEDTAVNIEDEFAQLEQKEVVPVAREETVKKGIMAPPPPPSIAGAKRSRNAILAQLKASRQSQAEFDSQAPTSMASPQDDSKAEQPQLGSKFRRIGEKEETSRIERDERGRETLVIRDRNGKVIKRKVRKVNHVNGQNGSGKRGAAQNDGRDEKGLLLPTNIAQPLGAEVSDLVSAAAAKKGAMEGNTNEDEGDIFEGIGTDYDPLSPSDSENDPDDDYGDDANSSRNRVRTDDNEDNPETASASNPPEKTNGEAEIHADKEALVQEKNKDSNSETSSITRQNPQPFRPRNYFATSSSGTTSTDATFNPNTDTTTTTANDKPTTNPLSDPTLLSALKKASIIHQSTTNNNNNNPATTLPSSDPQTPQSINNNLDKTQHNTTLHARLQAQARASDRDLEDLDLGFGSSRFGDAEDMALDADVGAGKGRNTLAEWDGGRGGRSGLGGGDDDDGDDDVEGKKGNKEKKNKKNNKGKGKGKGDKNNVDEILGRAERLRGER